MISCGLLSRKILRYCWITRHQMPALQDKDSMFKSHTWDHVQKHKPVTLSWSRRDEHSAMRPKTSTPMTISQLIAAEKVLYMIRTTTTIHPSLRPHSFKMNWTPTGKIGWYGGSGESGGPFGFIGLLPNLSQFYIGGRGLSRRQICIL